MITRDILLSNGYNQFPPSSFTPHSQAGFQKCIRDKHGKKYFITFHEYYFPEITKFPRDDKLSYSVSVQFTLLNNEHMNIDYLYDINTSLTEIESFYDSCFYNLNCVHYQTYGEH